MCRNHFVFTDIRAVHSNLIYPSLMEDFLVTDKLLPGLQYIYNVSTVELPLRIISLKASKLMYFPVFTGSVFIIYASDVSYDTYLAACTMFVTLLILYETTL